MDLIFNQTPDWPAPTNVKAYVTTRENGYSTGSFASFNLAYHVGDDPEAVKKNRNLLRKSLNLPAEPKWLRQTHSNKIVRVNANSDLQAADAAYTTNPNTVCAVLTADCLPILICNRQGTLVAALHAGWRGLAAGIIENAINILPAKSNDLIAWLGPAIGREAFEVGEDVRALFVSPRPQANDAFKKTSKDKYLVDIYLLAKHRLNKSGVFAIFGDENCTFSNAEQFYSYRRNGTLTGRIVSLIWFQPGQPP